MLIPLAILSYAGHVRYTPAPRLAMVPFTDWLIGASHVKTFLFFHIRPSCCPISDDTNTKENHE